MILATLILLQAAPATPEQSAAKPCRAMGPKGKWIDLDPAICRQSTWDKVTPVAPVAAQSGATAMEFDISPEGRVENCRIVESSGSPELDAKACAITTEKARYAPAVDANGKPKRSPGRLKVSWRKPS